MRRRQRGFTLVEMMVGLAILSIVTLAMAGTFLVASRAVSNEARAIAADEADSAASLWLTRDLNSAARGVTSVTVTAAGCYATVAIQPSAIGATAATFNVSNRPGGCW